MKKIVMMVLMLIMVSSVESYAGRGLFGCCCGGGDEDCFEPLVTDLGIQWIHSFEGFKKWYTADGNCEMRVRSFYGSIEIEEDLKAGRGQKSLVIEGLDIMHKRVRGDVYKYLGEIMEKGRIIDCENATIRKPNAGRGVPFYH
jgi:hypothetical protein